MPKYLCEVGYSAEGLQGLVEDTASGRKAVVQKALKALGGKLDGFYFSFGDNDAVLIIDLPNNIAAASLAVAVGSSGLVQIRTTPLLTVDEMDKALAVKAKYRAPGAE